MKAKLSVTIITLNEEENIRPCLESVKWADEIVVCDSGSSDKTLEVCREYTNRIYMDEWRGFGAHKNLCLDRAFYPWVLSLDADERVSIALRAEIEGILEGKGKFEGYFIPRRNYFLGKWVKHCGWYPDYTLRLFKKDKGRFKERSVHEAVDVNGPIGYLEEPLEHYTYQSISDFLKRLDRYSTLAAEEMARSGKRCRLSRLLLHPPFTFLKMFFLQKGFLEGHRGLLISILYSFYTFSKYAKLWELERQKRKSK